MGFDIECIIDIHTYPGEFFCPVCRTLVYPNEALQSQCTHLYCKPCLAHVANGSRACPYDGYLVTESESKPLIESDKALADKIGKVKVHCLFHRSGCTWEGPLSECTSHCSGCTFGNSPVICNRCGVQIVHRQVHDHAQSCPGVYQTQQTAENAQGASSSGPTSTMTAADSNQTAAQPGAPTSQAQNPQSTAAPLLPGQDLNHQVNSNFQAPTGATTAVPTPEQWYQQQYQQYYQQYAGYDPHQQPYHQYYPNQQQPLQQYQQNSLHMQGHHQSQAHAQPQQPQTQLQPQPQIQPQLHPQTQPPQPQPQPNVQPQPQPPLQPQTQSQSQVPAQGQPQMHAHVPAAAPAPGHQINPLQQLHPAMQSQAQVLTQALPPPPGQSAPQPVPYPQGQTHPLPVSMRPPVQQQQMPQYSQPQSLMYYTQASQVQHPPQMHPQPQLQPHLPAQPQAHLQHPPQSHPQLRPQLSQPTAPTPQPQAQHTTAPAVTGHHSYPLPHPAQQVQSGALQQHPMHPYPNGSLPPAHIHGQVSQQPAFMRPPHSHGQLPQQQASTVFPPQGQVSGIPPAQQQQFQPQAQLPVHQIQHMPVIQPVRHTVPQQPFLAPVQSQLQQHGHFVQQQQPPQPQLLTMQQNVAVPQSSLPLQSMNYVRRPVMENHMIPPQSFPQSSAGFGAAQLRPALPNLNQPSTNQSYARSVVLERPEDHVLKNHETAQGVGSPSDNIMRKDFKVLGTDADVKSVTSETVQNNDQKYIGEMVEESGQNRTVDKDADRIVDAAEVGAGSSLNSSDGKLVETAAAENKYATDNAGKDEVHSLMNHDSSQQKETRESWKMELQKATNAGLSSAEPDKGSHTDGHPPRLQVQGHPQPMLKPQEPALPQPGHSFGQSFNQIELQSPLRKHPVDAPLSGIPDLGSHPHFGRGPGQLGPRPGSYEPHFAQGPPPTLLAPGSVDPRGGIMGRAPPLGPEVHFGSHPFRANEPERGPLGRLHGADTISSRLNTGAGPDSSKFGLHDEKFKALAGDYPNSFQMENTQPHDQAVRPLDPHHGGGGGPPPRFLSSHHPPAGLLPSIGGERDLPVPYDGSRGRVGPGRGHPDLFGPGPEFGRDHMTHFPPRSPDREYHGISSRGFGSVSNFPHGHSGLNDVVDARRFGEGSRSFNLPSDPAGRDGRFPHLSSHMWRGDVDGPGNFRFGEHMAPGPPLNHTRDDIFGPGVMPGQVRRGEFLTLNLSSQPHMGEPAGYGPVSSLPRFGEPGFRSNFSLQGDADSFDKSRKRKSISMGWCRICRIDCETVEGLDAHSQTREHQKMAMDLVISIKQQSRRKQKTSGGRAAREDVGKKRNIGYEGRGNKH